MMARLLKVVLPLLIIAGGVAITAAMVRASKPAERDARPLPPPLVELAVAQRVSGPARVSASGVVEAERRVRLLPEVSGRVVKRAPKLVLGGRVAEGDVLLRIDGRAYGYALHERRGQLAQAKMQLELEEARGEVAKREWELYAKEAGERGGGETAPNRRALRTPQREAARANLSGARAGLGRARLNVANTTIRAPFNATVVTTPVNVGQMVAPTMELATLVGTDRFHIHVMVSERELHLIEIPGFNAERGSRAQVSVVPETAGAPSRQGRVLRVVSELDRSSRKAKLIVTVEHPLDPEPPARPLMLGAFVRVDIEGRTLEGAVQVPSAALYDGRRLWIIDDDDRLRPRHVEIAWETPETVVVTAGIEAGERILLSRLSTLVNGMQVRIKGAGKDSVAKDGEVGAAP